VIAYVFDKFEPVSSISPDVFRWYEESGHATTQAAQFNLSACGTTLPYTSTNVIPNAATIYGTSPFTPYGSSPLATDFYWDLQDEPTLTAAAWAASQRVKEYSNPAAPPAPPKPPLAPSNSNERRLLTHGSPEMAASSAASPHAGTGRSNSALTPAVISTALDEHIRRKLANKYCSDSDAISNFNPGYHLSACTTSQSKPLGCAGSIDCSTRRVAKIQIGPFLSVDFGGSFTWDYGVVDGVFLIAAEGCLSARVVVGVPFCKWCKLFVATIYICFSSNTISCAEADGGFFTELIATVKYDFRAIAGLLRASLTLQTFRYPEANPTWCPEERANYVNGENHDLTLKGGIKFCFIWCFNIYSGNLVPLYSNNAYFKARRENGYGSKCWDRGNPRCRTGICNVCEKGAGSCCRSNFKDWTPECVGQGALGRHRCGDTNVACQEQCGEKDSTGNFIPGQNKEECIRETRCLPPPPPSPPPAVYTLMNEELSWLDANAACLAEGLQLASVHSEAENDLLVTAAAGNQVWIGGTDANSEGRWVWSPSNTPLSYRNWHRGNPDNLNGRQDCLMLGYGNPGEWDDRYCTGERKYICESRA